MKIHNKNIKLFCKKTTLIFFLCCFNNLLFSQDYGLNNHTNRDISYFSHVDQGNNTILIGTTEKDITFTDILVTKIDENYNLLWQEKISIETNLSYDIPIKSFINDLDELFIIGRSSYNQSSSNGLIFVLKIDEDGNIIYNKSLENFNGVNYYDFGYLDAELNNDGTMNIVYNPISSTQPNQYFFLKLDFYGNIINSFAKEITQDSGIIGKIKNGVYYFLSKNIVNISDDVYSYRFHKMKDNTHTNIEITNTEFINYYKNSVLSEQVNITIDVGENLYFVCQNTSNHDTKDLISFSKINSNDFDFFTTTTSEASNFLLVNTFLNVNDQIIIIANNIDDNSLDFIQYKENNTTETVSSIDNFFATGFKKNEDDSFFLTTSNSNIRLYSHELIETASFTTSDSYELIDFSKINDETISAIGTSYAKMFPESDFFTQLNIEAEKINTSGISQVYSYSGIGTSKVFQQRIIIDNDNNYLVLITEKMGPEYLGIGGTDPPLNKRIIKYDSNLVKLWEIQVPDYIFNIVNHGGRDIQYYFDEENFLYLNLPRVGDYFGLGYDLFKVSPQGEVTFLNESYIPDNFFVDNNSVYIGWNYFLYEDETTLYILDKSSGDLTNTIEIGHEEFFDFFSLNDEYYFYTYENINNNTPDIINLYKNGIKVFQKNISTNYGIVFSEIDKDGSLFYTTDLLSEYRVNKLDINNNLTYYTAPDDIKSMKLFENGYVFLFLDNEEVIILDNNLNYITTGDSINSSYPLGIKSFNDYILFGHYSGVTFAINLNGELVNTYGFTTHDWFTKIDNEGNVITVYQMGNIISTFNEYSWSRGFISKTPTLGGLLSLPQNNLNKNKLIVYPNPTSDFSHVIIDNQNVEKIVLYDVTGKKIKETNKSIINLNNFKRGLYIMKIYTKSSNVFTSKVIKN
jgi:hypothetical protein